MTESEKPMSEQESLALITAMIQKAKSHFHQSGTSAILWGSVIGFCGLFTFLQFHFGWDIGGLDVWLLALFAIIPQIFIGIKERRKKLVRTHMETAIDAVWTVYGISVFALIFYLNIIPGVSEQLLAAEGKELLVKNIQTNELSHWRPGTFSQASLLMMLYAIPTLATGIAMRFKPMLIGGILCYILFVISCYTENEYDWLLNGMAGIFNWLIPGLILRKRYFKAKAVQHV